MSNNGRSSDVDTYIVRVERVEADGKNTPVCEGEVLVPETEDIIALDDLLEAIKVHDLWADGGDGFEEDDFEGHNPH